MRKRLRADQARLPITSKERLPRPPAAVSGDRALHSDISLRMHFSLLIFPLDILPARLAQHRLRESPRGRQEAGHGGTPGGGRAAAGRARCARAGRGVPLSAPHALPASAAQEPLSAPGSLSASQLSAPEP